MAKSKTCIRCQSIPRYTVQQEGPSKKFHTCWAHLQRTIDELIHDTKTGVVVRRS